MTDEFVAEWIDRFTKAKPKMKTKPPRTFVRTGIEQMKTLTDRIEIPDGALVLDFGCGCGRMGIPLWPRNISYTGLDARVEAIKSCKRMFPERQGWRFEHFAANNPRYFRPGTKQLPLKLPADTFDLVMAISVFTHMPDITDATFYLGQLAGVTAPGGHLLLTWFTDPPLPKAESDARRSIFTVEQINGWIADAGLRIVEEWGAGSEDVQLHTLCRKPAILDAAAA